MTPVALGSVAEAIGAQCAPGDRDIVVRRVVADSREVRAGDLFVAVPGQRADGHRFIPAAFEAGAEACLASVGRLDGGLATIAKPVLRVQDSVESLGDFAQWYRQTVLDRRTTVVAVTGSNGKTTTKRMIDCVLSRTRRGHCSPKSFNNNLGVPLTLLSADSRDDYLVVEIGTNAPGEVAALASRARPDVAVITGIGEAHLAGLGTVEAIAEEKASILPWVRNGGLAVVNIDRPEILPFLRFGGGGEHVSVGFHGAADVRICALESSLTRTSFELRGRKSLSKGSPIEGAWRMSLGLPGTHHGANAAAAFIVGIWFGLQPSAIIERLESFSTEPGRACVNNWDGLTVVDDTYNANPPSVIAAIEALARVTDRRRVFVLGDMFELGERSSVLHGLCVAGAIDRGIELLVTVGEASGEAARQVSDLRMATAVASFSDAESAAANLPDLLRPGDVVWAKGSRAMGLELIVDRLRAGYASPAGA